MPADIWDRLNDNGRILRDTDWHIHRLYDGLLPGATTVRATFHRYVIDANRDPSGQSLYPGQNTTGLVPLTDFDDQPIWKRARSRPKPTSRPGLPRSTRRTMPRLAAEIERVKAKHGVAVLYDCHSIRSHMPVPVRRQAAGFQHRHRQRQDLRAADRRGGAQNLLQTQAGYTHILNGRFKGGWTTRHYGRPRDGVHAIQMELAQSTHLATEAPPFAYDEAKARRLRAHLTDILAEIERAAKQLAA